LGVEGCLFTLGLSRMGARVDNLWKANFIDFRAVGPVYQAAKYEDAAAETLKKVRLCCL